MITKTLALLALAVVTTTAQAGTSAPAKGVIAPTIEPESSISYSNISLSKQYASGKLGATQLPINNIELDLEGFALALEYSPADNLYVALGVSRSEVKAKLPALGFLPVPLDFEVGDYWAVNTGIGGFIPLTKNIHFVTELGANYAVLFSSLQSSDALTASDASDWGFYAIPHIRAQFGKFETHVGASYTTSDTATSEWNGFLRLLYAATPELDLFVTGSFGLADSARIQDFQGVNFGLRYKF